VKKITFLILLFLQVSCFGPTINQNYCEEMAMKAYRGWPKASYHFNKFCKKIPIKYSKSLCQKALVKLILGFKDLELKNMFGSKIMNCFTENDLNKWLKH